MLLILIAANVYFPADYPNVVIAGIFLTLAVTNIMHSSSFTNIANSQVTLEEQLDDLVLLHKMMPGVASRSYCIKAARLAVLSHHVV